MATSMAEEIATLLAGAISSLTLATSSGGNLYTMPLPVSAADDAAHVIEAGGLVSLRTFGASAAAPAMDRCRYQVLLRSGRQGIGGLRVLADSVFEALDGYYGTPSSREIQWIEAEPPLYVKQDEEERHRYVVNLTAQHRRST